jgi:hypothetical protein
MGLNEKKELAEKLLNVDEETFKLAVEIYSNTDIMFGRMPVIKPIIFNINIIKELNTAQLKLLHDLILTELEKREDK